MKLGKGVKRRFNRKRLSLPRPSRRGNPGQRPALRRTSGLALHRTLFVTVHRGLSRFSRRSGRCHARTLDRRENGTVPLAPREKFAGRFHCCAAFVLGVLIVLSPWAIRNQLQFGRPIVTTTHGGYTLLVMNNPEFYQWLRTGPWGSVWRANRFNAAWDQRKPHDELAVDRLAYSEAWETIRRSPGTFVYACLVRLGRFCALLPHQLVADETPLRRFSRYAVAVWYIVEFVLAAVGIWHILFVSPRPLGDGPVSCVSPRPLGEGPGVRAASSFAQRQGPRGEETDDAMAPPSAFPLPPSPWLWGLLLVVCLMAPHTVYGTDMRMRAPVMPVVALAAAAGLCRREQHA